MGQQASPRARIPSPLGPISPDHNWYSLRTAEAGASLLGLSPGLLPALRQGGCTPPFRPAWKSAEVAPPLASWTARRHVHIAGRTGPYPDGEPGQVGGVHNADKAYTTAQQTLLVMAPAGLALASLLLRLLRPRACPAGTNRESTVYWTPASAKSCTPFEGFFVSRELK